MEQKLQKLFLECVNELNKIGIDGGELSKTRNYKDSYSEGIEYIFTTDDVEYLRFYLANNNISKDFLTSGSRVKSR